jgi:hypothetical protein
MFGKNPRMNPLETRKQLLIAESEVNRLQLVKEWQMMAGELGSVAHRARTTCSVTFAAATLISGLLSLRRRKSGPAGEKRSWWRTLLKAAQWAGTLWLGIRPQPKKP